MPSNIPWHVSARDHPGSSNDEIENEPDWTRGGHNHRIGVRNRQNRWPGLTRDEEEAEVDPVSVSEAENDLRRLRQRQTEKSGPLISFRDVLSKDEEFHLRYPGNLSIGWRYVVEATEDWVKNGEKWPANIKREEKAEQAKKDQAQHKENGAQSDSDEQKGKEHDHEHEESQWKRQQGSDEKHNAAYATDGNRADDSQEKKSEYERLLERYSAQEISLLRALQHEKNYRQSLKQNDGKRASPQNRNRTTISIDERDQFSPDNWLPRSDKLIRLTGNHPLNAEAELTALYDGGLITPNELHYVRNHGAVPRLIWEIHTLQVQGEGGKEITLSMDDLKHKFNSINIPISLACDGNRRKELNMIRKSKGFSWGSGATGCAYWKGPLLRDVLLAAGIQECDPYGGAKQKWVNFQGADELSEGKYETCIPLAYAMDPENDVLLPYEMNDVPLPPDHGYPVRLMIPGYVGGRCVKWLKKIWISDAENQSHYHIWDNRVLPSFITEKDGDFATTMFHHPDTACNEQNLNSIIVKPAQGETIPLTKARKGETYRIEGYAYDGGGHEVQRVEISLDGGSTWLYCIRKFPEYPIRHGNKFWTWVYWHVDVSITHLLATKSITVRAWNVFKNTQPENPSWNTMGMMNNCWYVVKPEIVQGDDEVPAMLFRHPVEPGTRDGGWMKPSEENKIASAKQAASAPEKQFTRQEIEKHDHEKDCWLVIDGKVYDATSVLSWHPGGKAAILSHAGKVHQDTSDEFASIHDDFAYKKLNECVLGVITEKAAKLIKANAEAAAKEAAQSSSKSADVVLQKHRWVPVTLVDRQKVSDDTRRYTFALPDGMKELGLGTCQHIQLGFHFQDKMVIRSYTPVKPVLPPPKQGKADRKACSGEADILRDGQGSFELVIKTYFPTEDQPGGAMSNILDCIPLGEEVEIKGPTGDIVYKGSGQFRIMDKDSTFKKINLVLGGSGLTPGYALIARAMLEAGDDVQIKVVDANKTEADILLHEQLTHLEKESQGRLTITHVLSHASDDWKGLKGHVNADILKNHLFAPEEGTVCFLCGPPTMIQKAALPALKGEFTCRDDRGLIANEKQSGDSARIRISLGSEAWCGVGD